MYCAIIIFVEPIKSKATVRELCLYAPSNSKSFPPFKTQTGPEEFLKQSPHSNYKNYLLHQFLQPMEKWFLIQQRAFSQPHQPVRTQLQRGRAGSSNSKRKTTRKLPISKWQLFPQVTIIIDSLSCKPGSTAT